MGYQSATRRAVAELLQEASRARVRAQTMGPAGWMKCPLRGTNKRFLINTLRTATQQRRPIGQPRTDQSGAKTQEAELRAEPVRSRAGQSPKPKRRVHCERHRNRSRSPVAGPDAAHNPSKRTVIAQACSPRAEGVQKDTGSRK
ncbi:ATP-dependent RNA helicase DHX8-like [Scleropages formosus]|uniref:ATP-dependent RNA helicase DHX8-like n=1 Tax=Scleropages formosus TaxID=113540 RepID=A0A0P7TNN3_SCLFO|nr:ATP-dependent RNA helicase DHX8-like [Scleropages formosus]